MDKHQALAVLIDHSFFLTDKVKNQILDKLPTLSDEDVENLGTFLALEKQKSLENSNAVIDEIDKIIEVLDIAEDR